MAKIATVRALEGPPDWPALMIAPVAAARLSLPEPEFPRGVAHGTWPAPAQGDRTHAVAAGSARAVLRWRVAGSRLRRATATRSRRASPGWDGCWPGAFETQEAPQLHIADGPETRSPDENAWARRLVAK